MNHRDWLESLEKRIVKLEQAQSAPAPVVVPDDFDAPEPVKPLTVKAKIKGLFGK